MTFGSKLARSLLPGLYLVGTPIGNLGDITYRAVETLKAVDRIYCEDTRVSRKLCEHFDISTPLSSYHEHNAERVRPQIVEAIVGGATVALISDAGLPLISDPGYPLVVALRQAELLVTSVPGPSAVPTALQLSGLPSDRFTFAGFAPTKLAARQSWFKELSSIRSTLVFFDSAKRIAATLDSLIALGEGARKIAVTRELTKRFEEVIAGTVDDVRPRIEALKGEVTVVLAPVESAKIDIEGPEVLTALTQALETQPMKAAANEVASHFGLSKRDVYQRALSLKK